MNGHEENRIHMMPKRKWYSRYDKMEILKKTKGVCAACGKKLKVETLHKNDKKQEGRELMTVDHVIPLQRGGWDDIPNTLPLCETCNSEKRNMLYVPASYYTAIAGTRLLAKITQDFTEWFCQDMKQRFKIEQYPMIAPAHNLQINIGASYQTRHMKKTVPYIAGNVITWEYMGSSSKEEVLSVTHISLSLIKKLLCKALEDTMRCPDHRHRMMAVYTCRKKTTGKILTAACVVYDSIEHRASVYIPWTQLPKAYCASIIWSFIITLSDSLAIGRYELKDIMLIVPPGRAPILQQINEYMVDQLVWSKKKDLYTRYSVFTSGEGMDYLVLRISEEIVCP